MCGVCESINLGRVSDVLTAWQLQAVQMTMLCGGISTFQDRVQHMALCEGMQLCKQHIILKSWSFG